MELVKRDQGFAPHVSLQQTAVGFQQIDQNQSIDGIGKMRVQIELEDAASQIQILTQQHRNAFLIRFEIGDKRRKLRDVLHE